MIPLEGYGRAAGEAYGIPYAEVARRLRGPASSSIVPRKTRGFARRDALIAASDHGGHSMNSACAAYASVRTGGNTRWYRDMRAKSDPAVVEWIAARAVGGDPKRPASIPAVRVQPIDVIEAAVSLGADWTTFVPPGHPRYRPSARPSGTPWRRIVSITLRRITDASYPEIAFFVGCASHASVHRAGMRTVRPGDAAFIQRLTEASRDVAAARTAALYPIQGGTR